MTASRAAPKYAAPATWTAAGVLLWSWTASRGPLSVAETWLFERVNRAHRVPDRLIWLVMQLGTAAMIVIAPIPFLVARRRADAAQIASAAALAWGGAKAIKALHGRGRPADLLGDVVLRDRTATGTGFVSGHAAVATATGVACNALTAGAVPAGIVCAAVGVVGLGRVRAGAHLPLDVLGGGAYGLLSASAALGAARWIGDRR